MVGTCRNRNDGWHCLSTGAGTWQRHFGTRQTLHGVIQTVCLLEVGAKHLNHTEQAIYNHRQNEDGKAVLQLSCLRREAPTFTDVSRALNVHTQPRCYPKKSNGLQLLLVKVFNWNTLSLTNKSSWPSLLQEVTVTFPIIFQIFKTAESFAGLKRGLSHTFYQSRIANLYNYLSS